MSQANAPTSAPAFNAEDRASYRFWTRETLRYADLDPVGHVNNNAYGVFIENARTMMFDQINKALKAEPGAGDAGAGEDNTAHDWVIRRIEIDFLREIRYPNAIETGLACTRMGNSSMILWAGVFTRDYCAATSLGVSVCFDPRARAATRIPDPVRRAVQDLIGS